jgi:hypothetical protein
MRLLGQRLNHHGRKVEAISLSQLLWQAIDRSEGVAELIDLERQRGFDKAQEQANTYLTHEDFGLCFMGLPERDPPGNYRVKIYG